MAPSLSPQAFVHKRRNVQLKESAAGQQHFLDAYGWPHILTDEEIRERLLALNLHRAGQ